MLEFDIANAATSLDGWLTWRWQYDANETRRKLPETPAWLIVDHYALDARWEREMRDQTDRIMIIDDLADRPHDCDLLLDQNIKSPSAYDNLVPADCRTLIGPQYALLRPEFAAARRARDMDRVSRLNVCMGGTDNEGATMRAVRELAEVGCKTIPIDIIIGSKCPTLPQVRELATEWTDAELHVDTRQVAALFAKADLAIGAGGVASLERCAVGLPTISLSIARNQELGLAGLEKHRAVEYLGPLENVSEGEIGACAIRLMASPSRLRDMSDRSASLVDGAGCGRVANKLLGSAGSPS